MSTVKQTDSMVPRERIGRILFVLPLLPLLGLFGHFIGSSLAEFFRFSVFVGNALGFCLGVALIAGVAMQSFIMNDTTMAFLTIDPLRTIFGSEKAFVTYGPGFHFCYPWEKRTGGNVVDLTEAAEVFPITAQAMNGVLKGKFAIRLRPNISTLPEFLSGVASVASEIGGLVSAEIIDWVKDKTTGEVLANVRGLNSYLHDKFVQGDSPFELRFGVTVGDVTVEELLPDEDVQKTSIVLAESEFIDLALAKHFGYTSIGDLQVAIRAKEVDGGAVEKLHTRLMAMSGNLQGMKLDETTHNINLTGLDKVDPAFGTALGAILATISQMKGATNVNKQSTGGGNRRGPSSGTK